MTTAADMRSVLSKKPLEPGRSLGVGASVIINIAKQLHNTPLGIKVSQPGGIALAHVGR